MTTGNRSTVHDISIHALREEGDVPILPAAGVLQNFYPRPPRGGRLSSVIRHTSRRLFLSTPSARRATQWQPFVFANSTNFYPRPPRGGRHHIASPINRTCKFLSTPSARRATRLYDYSTTILLEFLSTPSARRATKALHLQQMQGKNFYPRPPRGGRQSVIFMPSLSCLISIHALREEGDLTEPGVPR